MSLTLSSSLTSIASFVRTSMHRLRYLLPNLSVQAARTSKAASRISNRFFPSSTPYSIESALPRKPARGMYIVGPLRDGNHLAEPWITCLGVDRELYSGWWRRVAQVCDAVGTAPLLPSLPSLFFISPQLFVFGKRHELSGLDLRTSLDIM